MTAVLLRKFGTHLRDMRQGAGMTQEELANAAGLTAKYISELEHGKTNPSLVVLHALAEKGFDSPLGLFLAFDVGGNDAREQARELAVLLAGQPQDVRHRLMKMIRAFVDE